MGRRQVVTFPPWVSGGSGAEVEQAGEGGRRMHFTLNRLSFRSQRDQEESSSQPFPCCDERCRWHPPMDSTPRAAAPPQHTATRASSRWMDTGPAHDNGVVSALNGSAPSATGRRRSEVCVTAREKPVCGVGKGGTAETARGSALPGRGGGGV